MSKRQTKRIVGSLGMIGAGVVLGAVQADAQTRSGAITVSGSNAQVCTLAISPGGTYNTLNLSNSATDATIGTSVESCNDLAGYTVTVVSANGGPYLKGQAAQNSTTLAYGVNYGSNSTLTFASGTATADSFTSYSQSANYNHTVTVGVSYAGTPALPADTYTDTLTFSLATN